MMMTAKIENGDYDIRGRDMDQRFANAHLDDDALSAAVLTTVSFDPSFPGWQLYRRIVAGVDLHNRELEEWVIGCARLLAKARNRKTGRMYVQGSHKWIDTVARDALASFISGHPVRYAARAREIGVHPDTYKKMLAPMMSGIANGFDEYRTHLSINLRKVRQLNRRDNIEHASSTSASGSAQQIAYALRHGVHIREHGPEDAHIFF